MSDTKKPVTEQDENEHQEHVFHLHEGQVRGKKVEGGPFPPKRHFGEHEQGESRSRHVPTTREPRPLKHPSPPAKIFNTDDPSAGDNPDPVIFFKYDPSGQTGSKSFTDAADISGTDSGRDVVLLSGNWYCDYSLDGGATFTRVNPTTIFPAGFANGFCCDQVVDYIPSIDRFVWFMQHNADASGGAFRLAAASTGDILKNFSTAWTYWDFRASDFGLGTDDLDYPDLSFSEPV